jgi:hypothetical protein
MTPTYVGTLVVGRSCPAKPTRVTPLPMSATTADKSADTTSNRVFYYMNHRVLSGPVYCAIVYEPAVMYSATVAAYRSLLRLSHAFRVCVFAHAQMHATFKLLSTP